MTEYSEKKAEFCVSCAHETAAKALAEQVLTMRAEIDDLKSQLSDVSARRDEYAAMLDNAVPRALWFKTRDATCAECGRSLPPDGDCYGCQADRLGAENARLRMESAEAFDRSIERFHAAIIRRRRKE